MDVCKIQVGILNQFKNTYIHNKKIFVILKLKLMYNIVTINKTNKLNMYNILYYILYVSPIFNFNFVFLYYPDSQFLIIMSRFTQI